MDAPNTGNLPSIIEALSVNYDVETVARILGCKRTSSSPSIHEPCLQPLLQGIENWETALFEHPKVLDRLLICPSVYEIPWKAAVVAIRHYADDCNSALALDVEVLCFLQNVHLVWTDKRRRQENSKANIKSSAKKLRRGDTLTAVTPAKWLLRMAEVILETTTVGRTSTTTTTTTFKERVKNLLLILASILSLASDFDSNLSRELMDRTFIRHLVRPDIVDLVLLYLATRDDIQALMQPSDWRGLQASLRNDAALGALTALPIEELVEVMPSIVRIGRFCSTVSTNKMLQRWADILILTLKACNGSAAAEKRLVAAFAALSAPDFKRWYDELLSDATNTRHPNSVARALVLLAEGRDARHDAPGWKIDFFWKKMKAISSWSSVESFQLKRVLYEGHGVFKGSESISRIGVIVFETLQQSNGDCSIKNGRLWTSYSIEALLDGKLQAVFAAAVIATVFFECRALQLELIDQLMNHAVDNVDVANAFASIVSFLSESTLSYPMSSENLVNLLSLPISLEMFAILSSQFSKRSVLQSQLFELAKDRLGTLLTRECKVKEEPPEMSELSERFILVLMDLLEQYEWSNVQVKARNLLSGVVISNDPPIPLEVRIWLHRTLGSRIEKKVSSKEHHVHYFRICMLRALTFYDDVEAKFCFDSAFVNSNDSFVQLEDFTSLFELLLLLFRSCDPLAYKKLQQMIVRLPTKSDDTPLVAENKYSVSESMLIHFPLLLGRSVDGPLHVKRFIFKLTKDEFLNSVPASVSFGLIRYCTVDSTAQAEKQELVTANVKRAKFHSLLRLILSNDTIAKDDSPNNTEHVESRLVAISRCLTDYLRAPQNRQFHPETAELVLSAINEFSYLVKASFNQICGKSKRAVDVDTILAAVAVFCEVSSDVVASTASVGQNYERLMSSWEVYLLLASEWNARSLISYLEKNWVGARNVCWDIDTSIDDNIRRVRSGVLRLFQACLRVELDNPCCLEPSQQTKVINCIQKASKRLCKDLILSQEGLSGGLSHNLYLRYIECIDYGLRILEANASNYVEESASILDDVAKSCTFTIQTVVATISLQNTTNLKKTLLLWLWQAPKLSRTLCILKLQNGFKVDEPVSLDGRLITLCFEQVSTIAINLLNSGYVLPWSVHELPVGSVVRKAASAPSMLNLSNEKMWEGAFIVILQVVKNHFTESIQRMEHENMATFASAATLAKFCLARSNQLESLLKIVGIVLESHEESCKNLRPTTLVVLELPLLIKTEISLTCDAFLCSVKQAFRFLSMETDDLDTASFAEAAACMISWLKSSIKTKDVVYRMLLWKSDEQKASPHTTSEALQRRLTRMSTKINDLSNILRRIVSNKAKSIVFEKLDDILHQSFKDDTTSTSFKEMICARQKSLEDVVSLYVSEKQPKKRRRTNRHDCIEDRNPIVGKWLDIDREKGRDNDEFEDLDDFIVEG